MADYPRESKLEKFIKDFVYRKLAEHVELTLQDSISIRPVPKKGSIVLATFWANVLQHPKNFPKDQCDYREVRDDVHGATKLIGKAEDVTFTVLMANGTLNIKGAYIYEWFTRRFKELLDNADPDFADRYTYVPSSSDPYPMPETWMKEPLGDVDTETEKYLSLRNREYTELPPMYSVIPDGPEDYIQTEGNLNVDNTLFKGEELEAELSSLSSGGMRDGFVYVYRLWKSLLDKWLSTPGAEVYLASPLLDAKRLEDVIRIYLRHRTNGKIRSFYTRQVCEPRGPTPTGRVQSQAIGRFSERVHTTIEYEVFRRMVYPVPTFNGKFIAAVMGEEVEVLVTSANFNGEHFTRENQESVFFVTMPKEKFESEYIKPISTRVVATM